MLVATRDLPQCRARPTYNLLLFSGPMTAFMAPFVEEKSVNYLKYHLDLAAWVLPGELNTTKNCAGCNEGLTTMPGETTYEALPFLVPLTARSAQFVAKKPVKSSEIPHRSKRRGCFQVS